jgi:F-type H+-transporting ATPase subunit alpha
VLKEAAGRLKLDYAQFVELEVFTRFGAMVDERTHQRIKHGRRIRALLAQRQFAPRSLSLQSALLIALKEGRLDDLDKSQLERFTSELSARLNSTCPEVIARIEREHTLADSDRKTLVDAIDQLVRELAVNVEGGEEHHG